MERLEEYADLIIKVGVNLQKGQKVYIVCPIDCAFFGRLLCRKAYENGAFDVIFEWRDDYCSRQHWLNADSSVFDGAYPWDAERKNTLAREGVAYIFVDAEDPENLKGVDTDRLRRWDIAAGRDYKEFYKLETSNGFPWCIASVPIKSWAEKVFPDTENATEKLWDAIYKTVRITGDGTAPEKWRAHCAKLEEKCKRLNSLGLKKLHYTNSKGTDLTVELPENHIFLGGGDICKSGVKFIANMPTEEVFGAPLKTGVNGTVYASKPLSLKGNLIEGICLKLKDGRIISATAEKGEEALRAAINADEGSHYLGEVALVPYDSPISNSGILFYNTLFDENASCHFAFGEAYSGCVDGGDYMTTEELCERGINADSCTHVDFMVGTPDLSIVGTDGDGVEIPIFVNGNFAI